MYLNFSCPLSWIQYWPGYLKLFARVAFITPLLWTTFFIGPFEAYLSNCHPCFRVSPQTYIGNLDTTNFHLLSQTSQHFQESRDGLIFCVQFEKQSRASTLLTSASILGHTQRNNAAFAPTPMNWLVGYTLNHHGYYYCPSVSFMIVLNPGKGHKPCKIILWSPDSISFSLLSMPLVKTRSTSQRK